MFEDRFDLFARDAFKPLEEFVDRRSVAEILEERSDRHAFPGTPTRRS
jgi:hypothetical protein